MSNSIDWQHWVEDYAEKREDGNIYVGFTLKREQWLNPAEYQPEKLKAKIESSLIEQAFRFSNAFSNYGMLWFEKKNKVPDIVEVGGRTKLGLVRNIDDYKD